MRRSRWFGSLLGLTLAALIQGGCVEALKSPNLAELYRPAPDFPAPDRNPVIVIPGSLGSRLEATDTGHVVWGSFGRETADPKDPEQARLIALPLRADEAWPQVEPTGVLAELEFTVLGLPVDVQVYGRIMATLTEAGYRDEELGRAGVIDYGDAPYNCFQFAYDWRLDNAANAVRLHEFILEKRAYLEREAERYYGIENYQARFDVIAHSMGGLLLRYYLRHGPQLLPEDGSLPVLDWAGAENIERGILVAPPNGGSAKALLNLVNGVKFAPGTPYYPAGLIGTYPASYQLLPRARHKMLVDAADPSQPVDDVLDIDLWTRLGWGLASPDVYEQISWLVPDIEIGPTKRAYAIERLRHNLQLARQFQASLDRPARPPAGTDLVLIAGDGEPTPGLLGVNLEDGSLSMLERGSGDGSVLRSSALMDERVGSRWQPRLVSPIAWREVRFMLSRHFVITTEPAFAENVLYLLLEDPRLPSF